MISLLKSTMLFLFITFYASSVNAATVYDESVSGDLSSTDLGTLVGDSTIIGGLNGPGGDLSDSLIFRRNDKWKLFFEVDVISVELVALSLRGLGSGGAPNSVIIRTADAVVYINMLPGDYSLDLDLDINGINSLHNYQFTISTDNSIPEPATLLLVGIAIIGLSVCPRKNNT